MLTSPPQYFTHNIKIRYKMHFPEMEREINKYHYLTMLKTANWTSICKFCFVLDYLMYFHRFNLFSKCLVVLRNLPELLY